MRYLDVCSGISAPTQAWADLGFSCAGYAEIDAFPRAVLQERFGAVPVDFDHRHTPGSNITPLFGDFTRIMPEHVGPVDLLVGGTPCQAFSVAGKRLGLDDPRGNLTLEFLALARRLRAEWLVWENVPGFLSHDDGRTMGTFLRLLGELGYGFAYRVLDAQFIRVDGHERAVPQRRRRLFVVGHIGDAAGPAAVLFERESLRGDSAPRRQAGQGAAPTLSARTKGGGGLGTDAECGGALVPQAFGGNDTSGPIDIATARSAHGGPPCGPPCALDFESETFIAQPVAASLTRGAESAGKGGYAGRGQEDDVNLVAHSPRAEGFDASEDDTGRGTLLVPCYAINSDCLDRSGEGSGGSAGERAGLGVQEGVGYALRSKRPDAVAFSITPSNSNNDYNAREGVKSQALGTGSGHPSARGGDLVVHPMAFDARQRDVCIYGDVTGPLDTDQGTIAVHTGWAVRRLTPRECERLMGMPDDFTLITYRGKPAADGPRYKALGNSQARNQMRWIGRGMIEVAALLRELRAAA